MRRKTVKSVAFLEKKTKTNADIRFVNDESNLFNESIEPGCKKSLNWSCMSQWVLGIGFGTGLFHDSDGI